MILDIIYCTLLGICNYFILKEIFISGFKKTLLQGIANPRIRVPVYVGLIFIILGGIAHRYYNYNPNINSFTNWLIVVILPIILARLTVGKTDKGWSSLEHGKSLWKSLYPSITYKDGAINVENSQMVNHPKVIEAKKLIKGAIELSAQSNINPLRAITNKAIAWQELGLLHRVLNQFDEAMVAYQKSIEVLETEGGHNSKNKYVLSAYRETIYRIGELNQIKGNKIKAKECYLISLDIDEKLGHDEPFGEKATRELLNNL